LSAVRFPITPELLEESERFQLRSACPHCRYQRKRDGSCSLGWPNEAQRRWPIGASPGSRELAERDEVDFCKEFELT
jgi:hypothetical protein